MEQVKQTENLRDVDTNYICCSIPNCKNKADYYGTYIPLYVSKKGCFIAKNVKVCEYHSFNFFQKEHIRN